MYEYIKDNVRLERIMSVVLLLSISVIAFSMDFMIDKDIYGDTKEKKKTVVIDPGHGGKDPGKIAVTGVDEDDINMAIAYKLRDSLEEKGYETILTRAGDVDLCAGKFSKKEDLNNRCYIINKAYKENNNTIMISIHQNSYSDGGVWGAQCFYYAKSEKSKKIAESLQRGFNVMINVGNERIAKESDSYYMLKQTSCPAVIVECGFLSNWSEAEKLNTEEYQQRIADIIVENLPKQVDEADENTETEKK